MILMLDPGIFGANAASVSSSTMYLNRYNYTEDNWNNNTILMNNFISWMARVAAEGEEFLKLFQVP